MSGDSAKMLIAIAVSVAIWLAPLFLGAWALRSKGYSSHWTWFGILPLVGLVVLCVALLLPSRRPAAHAPVIVDQPPPSYRLPPSFVILLPAVCCAFLGGMSSPGGTFSISAPSSAAIIGGGIGLLLGLAVYLDDRAVQRRVEGIGRGAPLDAEAAAQPASGADSGSNAIAVIMLLLPLGAGILIWQREVMQLPTPAVSLLETATILSTALLGYCDMRLLVLLPRTRVSPPPGDRPISLPVGAFLGILGLWLLAYPVHFLVRRRLGTRNLFVPGLMVTAIFLAPTLSAWFSEPVLPSVGSPDVVALVAKMLEEGPMYQARKDQIGQLQVREPIEVSFDRERQRRVGRAKLVSRLGEEEIFYTVEWQDRKKGMFAIQLYEQQP
jgi:hypothetical protein